MKIRSLNHLIIYGCLLASYNFPKTCNVGLLRWFSITLPFTCTLYFTLTSINTSKFRLKMTCKNYFSLYILCCFFKNCLLKSVKKKNENISYLYKKLHTFINITWKKIVICYISLMDLSAGSYNSTYLCSDKYGGNICQIRCKFRTSECGSSWTAGMC